MIPEHAYELLADHAGCTQNGDLQPAARELRVAVPLSDDFYSFSHLIVSPILVSHCFVRAARPGVRANGSLSLTLLDSELRVLEAALKKSRQGLMKIAQHFNAWCELKDET